jgi:alpha-beta hydrolase superfamily lysophospholipase
VLLVAGINSHGTGSGPTLALPAAALGYRPDEVSYFSYAPDATGAYGKRDTYAPLLTSARRLAEQLRAMQRAEPGREVDLLAHSQGGVVVLSFLTVVYDRGDPTYPPLGTVVTLSSPLQGAPLATAGARIGRTESGRAALQVADKIAGGLHLPVPPALAPSVRDLAADSDLMRRLEGTWLPDQVELTTVGALTDLVVPAGVATRPEASHTVVATSPLNAHRAVLTDADALRAVRAAIERAPLPCRSLFETLAAAVIPSGITRLEHDVGTAGTLVAALADAAR